MGNIITCPTHIFHMSSQCELSPIHVEISPCSAIAEKFRNYCASIHMLTVSHSYSARPALLEGGGGAPPKTILSISHSRNSCLSFSRVKCGELEYYDKAYDRVNIKTEVSLVMVNRVFHKVTTTDDPVIRKVSQEINESSVNAPLLNL